MEINWYKPPERMLITINGVSLYQTVLDAINQCYENNRSPAPKMIADSVTDALANKVLIKQGYL